MIPEEFYLMRTLKSDDKSYKENELLDLTEFRFIVVLAEPGAGKTQLLNNLAKQLQTKNLTANVFSHRKIDQNSKAPIIVDAFDELAKTNLFDIGPLLGKLCDLQPSIVVLSSRASEWDEAYTRNIFNFFDKTPLLVYLEPFNESEQRQVFEAYKPEENFNNFQAEIKRFDLSPLLPNPQLLKLFADAYIESDRFFPDKKSIFQLAIKHLAKETNPNHDSNGMPFDQKIELTNALFAKLLLSGAEGVGISDQSTDERLYPRLESVIASEQQIKKILSSKLFKPGEQADQHNPVHKIIMEYCAATYLVKRLSSTNQYFSMMQCMSIIAPNSIVRNELRGLLGWLAALGNQHQQETFIEIDPYAVLANGDPSQLGHTSKQKLLLQLEKLAQDDPFFRRSDRWRTFSVSGFFTDDMVEMLQSMLSVNGEHSHLRDLLLELLAESSQITQKLTVQLEELVLSKHINKNTRVLANKRLLEVGHQKHIKRVVSLIAEATEISFEIAAQTIHKLGPSHFEVKQIANFLRKYARWYSAQDKLTVNVTTRFWVKQMIASLELEQTEWLLKDLSSGLSCTCQKPACLCTCLLAISKIIALLLDHFFKLSTETLQAEQLWPWLKNLKFSSPLGQNQSLSVQRLKENNTLRQNIIRLAFEKETECGQIHELKQNIFGFSGHTGLSFQEVDQQFVIDLAFEVSNCPLWSYYIPYHQWQKGKAVNSFSNQLRRHMKQQAQIKPDFLDAWHRQNCAAKRSLANALKYQKASKHFKKRQKKRNARNAKIHQKNIEYLQSDRERIESGKDWPTLQHFALLILEKPQQIDIVVGDKQLVSNALKNCVDFIEPHIPSLQELAELQCKFQLNDVETILYAACLEIFRATGTLNGVKPHLLEALRTNLGWPYSAVSAGEIDGLKTEINRLALPDAHSKETFLREYLEPQLKDKNCQHPQVDWLKDDKTFSQFKQTLSLEWLQRFDEMPFNAMFTLFNLAAQGGKRDELKALIHQRCEAFQKKWPSKTTDIQLEDRRTFWLLRAFYFLPTMSKANWDCLYVDKDSIFLFEALSGALRQDDFPNWPLLGADKVERILNSFFLSWSKISLPSIHATSSPKAEKAYRFLRDLVWSIEKENPDHAFPVLERLLNNQEYQDLHTVLKNIRATLKRQAALQNFEAPTPMEIVDFLDHNKVSTVEHLRALVLEVLQLYQKDLNGGDATTKTVFHMFDKSKREVDSTLHVADRLKLRLEPLDNIVTVEHQLHDKKRCDITFSKILNGKRKMLVVEVKGQWHKDLYTAASEQLDALYSIHPDAEQQGIYLVLWFGAQEKVANQSTHQIQNAQQLKVAIETAMPITLKGRIDVFVLDVSLLQTKSP